MKVKFQYIIKRSLAYFIDVSIVYLVLMLLFQLLILSPLRIQFGMDENWFKEGWNVQWYVWLTISLPTWLYFITSEASKHSATFGKRLFKLKVLKDKNSKLSYSTSFKRTALKLLPWELIHIGLNLPEPVWFQSNPEFRYIVLLGSVLFLIYFVMVIIFRKTPYDNLLNTDVI